MYVTRSHLTVPIYLDDWHSTPSDSLQECRLLKFKTSSPRLWSASFHGHVFVTRILSQSDHAANCPLRFSLLNAVATAHDARNNPSEPWALEPPLWLFTRAHQSWFRLHASIYFTFESQCTLNYHGSFVRPAPTWPEYNWCLHEATDFCTPGGHQSSSSSKAIAVGFGIGSNGPMTYFCYRSRFVWAGRGIRRVVSLTARVEDLVNESDWHNCVEDHENTANSEE